LNCFASLAAPSWMCDENGCAMKKKTKRELGEATLASVKKEMAKPRMAESARRVK